MLLVLITTCLMYRSRFFGHISRSVTNWAVQLISIVSLCLQDCLHQFSPWSGTTLSGAVNTDFRPKMSQKMVIWSFLAWFGEIESDSQSVWTCICTVVPRSVLPFFQVLICSCWRDSLRSFIRFLAGPVRTQPLYCWNSVRVLQYYSLYT